MKFNERMLEMFKPIFAQYGFKQSKYYENNGLIDFIRDNENSIHWIRMTFGVDKRGFLQVKEGVTFLNVIEILQKFDDIKLNFKEEIISNHDLYKNKEGWTKIYKRFGKLPLETDADIENFKKVVLSHVDGYIMPFMERFPDVQAVNDKILNELDFHEYPNFIPGNCTLKTLIIMKMCKNLRYDEYKEVKDKEYKFYVGQNPTMWQPSYDSFLKLTKYLGTT